MVNVLQNEYTLRTGFQVLIELLQYEFELIGRMFFWFDYRNFSWQYYLGFDPINYCN